MTVFVCISFNHIFIIVASLARYLCIFILLLYFVKTQVDYHICLFLLFSHGMISSNEGLKTMKNTYKKEQERFEYSLV